MRICIFNLKITIRHTSSYIHTYKIHWEAVPSLRTGPKWSHIKNGSASSAAGKAWSTEKFGSPSIHIYIHLYYYNILNIRYPMTKTSNTRQIEITTKKRESSFANQQYQYISCLSMLRFRGFVPVGCVFFAILTDLTLICFKPFLTAIIFKGESHCCSPRLDTLFGCSDDVVKAMLVYIIIVNFRNTGG